MKSKVWQMILAFMICGGGTVFAAEQSHSNSIYSLGEVVVTAPQPRGVETIGTRHEITADDIEIRQARSLDKALELLPGVDIRRGAQGIPRVNLRGMRSRHVLLLLNGIPFNSTYDGQFDPSTISTENVARIKVTYGNHSVLYGQGGLGGVINIVTKKGVKGLTGSVSADLDERGDYTTRADISGGNDTMDFFLSGRRLDSDGFQLSDDFDSTSQEDGGIRENSDAERDNLYANLGVDRGNFRLGLVAGGSQGEYGKPPSAYPKSDPFANSTKYERVDDYQGRFGQVSLGYDPGGVFDMRAWGYVNKNEEDLARYDDENYNAITNKNSYDRTDESEIYGGTLQAALNFEKKGRLAFSMNGEKQSYDSDGYEITNNSGATADIDISHDMEIFTAAAEYDMTLFDRLGVVCGYSHQWQNKDEGNDDDRGAWLLGVTYDLFAGTRLRTSYARKIRFASMKNLYDSDSGNADLTTESSDNFELGVTQLLPWGVTADVAVFRNEVEDYIQKDDTTNLFENNDEYRFKGVEISLGKAFDKADVNLGYSWMDAADKSQGASAEDLEYRPEHKITAECSYTFDFGLTAHVSYMRLMGQVFYNNSGDQGDLGDYSLVDLNLEQRVFRQTCFVYAGVNNLLDEDYEESYGFPQAGRTAYAGLKIRF